MTKKQVERIAQAASDLQGLIDNCIVPEIEVMGIIEDLLRVSKKVQVEFEFCEEWRKEQEDL